MAKIKKILITSGAWQAALACAQSLGRRKHEVFLIDEQLSALSHSRYCKRIQSPPEKDENRYIDFLLNLVKSGSYDVLFPISDSVARYCSRHKNELGASVGLLLPDDESFSLAVDKGKFYAFAVKEGFPIPQTYFPSNLTEIERLGEKNIFPCVLKLPVSGAGKGIFYINSREELKQAYQQQNFEGQWPVVQEFVDGEFYGLSCVARKGKIVKFFMYRTERKYSLEGTPPILFSVMDRSLLELARRIIDRLNWSGAINLDFLKDTCRGFLLLEANPRFGGTLNFAYRMGVDLPWGYCQLAGGSDHRSIKQPDYAQGVMFRTIFPTEIIRCATKEGYWKVFLRNFFKLKSKTNVYLDDPSLLWGQIRETRWYLQDIGLRKKRAPVQSGNNSFEGRIERAGVGGSSFKTERN